MLPHWLEMLGQMVPSYRLQSTTVERGRRKLHSTIPFMLQVQKNDDTQPANFIIYSFSSGLGRQMKFNENGVLINYPTTNLCDIVSGLSATGVVSWSKASFAFTLM
jgi:hypothetical protein